MKNKLIIALIACIIGISSCSGDSTPQNVKDTVNNRFGVSKDTSKIDTSKTKSDVSANGGVSQLKDSSKNAKP